jgi:hypothetical protein
MYELNFPDRGLVGRSYHFNGLMEKIVQYRQANGFPCGLGLEDEVEQAVCLAYPQEAENIDPRIPSTTMRLGWEDIVNGTRNLAAFIGAGRPYVSQDEANRRARICASCPFKGDFVRQCGSLCGKLLETIKDFVTSRSTPYDGQLMSCRVCKCHCQAIVWVPLKYQTPHLSQHQKDQYAYAAQIHSCWKNGETDAAP